MRIPWRGIALAFAAAVPGDALVLPTAAGATVTHSPAGGTPYGMAAGPDNALWFVEETGDKIGRITTAGVVTEYDLPANSQPHQIAAGPDGAMWFTETGTHKIGRITTAGVVTDEFSAGVTHPTAITASVPDNALWFTADGFIGRMTTTGTVTTNAAPGQPGNGIAVGPDNAIWFTGDNTRIGRMPTSGGAPTMFPLPIGEARDPWGIVAGPDNALWFAEKLGNAIGRIPTTATEATPGITEYPVPQVNGIDARPRWITLGPDGALWFTAYDGGRIGRITTAGAVTQFPCTYGPWSIASGSDGALWFTEIAGVGRITTDTDPDGLCDPAPGGGEAPPPGPSAGLRRTSTSVGGCGYNTATFYFFCTVTVADTGAAPASTPGGFINLARFPGGGCALGGPGGGGSARCLAVIVPPATESNRTVTATYAGDANHAGSSGSATLARIGKTVPSKPKLLDNVTLQPSSMFPAPSGPSTSRALPGAVVTYTLRAPARVRFTVHKPAPGRQTKVGKARHCQRASKRNLHGQACTRFVALRGSFTLLGKRGKNTFRFRGRIGGRTLRPGSYRLVATPSIFDVTGKLATRPFRVKRG